MTLDFVRLAPQLAVFAGALEHEQLERGRRYDRARALLEQTAVSRLESAVSGAKNANWLLAHAEEALTTHRPCPSLPRAYAALATDGSSIDVNRHAPVACYLINIGHAWLDYASAGVDLGNEAELEFAGERLVRADGANASKESALTGNLLDAYRTALEMLRLAGLAERHQGATPIVALLDGQFVLWGLKESELSSEARRLIFDDGVLRALDRLRSIAAGGGLVLGSYISRPAGREVTNTLRIVDCPRPGGADCRDCPRLADGGRPCDAVAGGSDAELFAHLLGETERSAIFRRAGTSSDLGHADNRYAAEGHDLRFFYIHVPGGEIARVEMPEWVAASVAGVDLLHATVLDQCERGGGYPLVLQEAHEQAVIDAAARRSFSMLLDRELELGGAWSRPSGKSWSKRRRPI